MIDLTLLKVDEVFIDSEGVTQRVTQKFFDDIGNVVAVSYQPV